MKIIHGDLVLSEDTTFDESITVEGDISCKDYDYRYSLTVRGNIDALDIKARNINARNIDALDIKARNIDALNIKARIVICEKRIKKKPDAKTICKALIQNMSELHFMEQMKPAQTPKDHRNEKQYWESGL